jgi:hypothetical protein
MNACSVSEFVVASMAAVWAMETKAEQRSAEEAVPVESVAVVSSFLKQDCRNFEVKSYRCSSSAPKAAAAFPI